MPSPFGGTAAQRVRAAAPYARGTGRLFDNRLAACLQSEVYGDRKLGSLSQISRGEGCNEEATSCRSTRIYFWSLRARLRGDVSHMADAALKKSRSEANGDLSSMPIHMADIGSDNFEQEFTLSLMENDGGTLAQIEASLERIEEGTYGQCEECGVKIPKSRLNAVPYATLCVRCAEQQEQRL